MFYCLVKEGEYVFKQGDDATCFFIINKGEVIVEIDGVVKKRMHKSEGFGDLALLYNAPRSASIKAAIDTYFWSIDRKTFKKVVSEITTKQYRENRLFLNGVNFF
jgi:cGMP-dependent protein kinase